MSLWLLCLVFMILTWICASIPLGWIAHEDEYESPVLFTVGISGVSALMMTILLVLAWFLTKGLLV